jgi:hypothetical protein
VIYWRHHPDAAVVLIFGCTALRVCFIRIATQRKLLNCCERQRLVNRSNPAKSSEPLTAAKRQRGSPGQAPRNTTQLSAWPKLNVEQREAAIASGVGLVDLWEISPVRFEDNKAQTEEIIDALFHDNPFLCCGRSNSDFETKPREEWRGQLAALQLVVPSPMTARTGLTQEGKESAHTLETTGPRRFLVIEQDCGTTDEQAAVLLHLAERAPLAVAVHSGSKSIHGWFYCIRSSGRKTSAVHAVRRESRRGSRDLDTFTVRSDARRHTRQQ